MKKMVFYAIGFLLPVCKGFGQTIKPLGVGDTVPDIVFKNIIHYKTTTAKLSDFKGKLVILDFWATWCGPCVKGMPKMDSLQKIFSNELVILPVTNEKQGTASAFFKREKNISLPSVVEDTILNLYFPKRIIPHSAIIDRKGRVISITNPQLITADVIKRLINDETVALPEKNDLMTFNGSAPLLLNGNGVTADQVMNHSLMTGYLPGLASQSAITYLNEQRVGLHYINLPVVQLFLSAYDKPLWYWFSRVVMEHVDSTERYIRTRSDELYIDNWRQAHLFSYDLVDPLHSIEEQRQVMQQDLQRFFYTLYGLKVQFLTRKIKAFVLRKIPNAVINKTTEAASYSGLLVENKTTVYKNIAVNDFASRLEQVLHFPVTCDVQLSYNIDIELDQHLGSNFRKLKDISIVQKALKKYGFDVTEGEAEMEVILLTENTKN